MHLSNEQIEQLHQFCKKHYVYYYEVEVELVDHLATEIELIMAADAKITFVEALDTVYKKFGPTGFRKIIVEKESYAEKRSNNIFWNYMKSFFKLPHIILTLLLITFFSLCYLQFKTDINVLTSIISVSIWILFVAELFILIYATVRNNKVKKSLLMTRFFLPGYFFLAFSSSLIWAKPMSYLFNKDEFSITTTPQYIFFSLIIIITILCTIAIIQSNHYMHQQAKKQFPQAFI